MNFKKGEVLFFNKPFGWTSFKVVGHARYHICRRIGVKKLKVGHAGTLDPLATGVMIVCTGKATKRIEEFQYHTKEYVATLRLGATTPSYDLEHEIDATYPTEHITRELVEEVLTHFIGAIDQVPPAFSACMVDGKRAYELARKGEEVELKAKQLVIDEIELLECRLDDPEPMIQIRVVCSKGTYIRALARDIGDRIETIFKHHRRRYGHRRIWRDLADAGITCATVNKVTEGRPHIVDRIKDGDVQLIFNTTEGWQSLQDSQSIRASALAAVCAGVAAAAAGFLCFNFHPARIFMGDVGSVPLGFTAGALGLVGWRSGAWPLWFPLLVFAPFILDATVTLLRRALRGEKVWQAHRSHYYQRMVQMGLGHRGTALRAYGLMAGCGAAALAGLRMGFSLQCAIITMCITAHLIVGYRIDRAWRRHRAGEPAEP